ncbi:MAG: RodZ domain-containing protein [Candidatus Thiodiazotropha sp.]
MSRDESGTAPDVVIGPGMQLRKARERQGLDQAKMAAQLHLSQAMIVALEADDFENLPGPVFVQGYLRKYSRLLGVNEDAVVDAYQNLLPVSDELQMTGTSAREVGRELHSASGLMRYLTWGILLLLVGLALYWWLTRVELNEPVSIPAQEQEQEQDQEQQESERIAAENLPMEQSVMEPAPAATAEEIAQTAPSPQVVEESEQVLNEIDDLLTSSDRLLGPVDEEPDQATETEAPAPLAPPQVAAPVEESRVEEVSEIISKQVVFRFSEPCWTEVRDQNGKLRIFGEIGSGRVRTLDSRLGPFSVLLGNAVGVKLTIDGEHFDLKPFTRGKVARFTLDPQRL